MVPCLQARFGRGAAGDDGLNDQGVGPIVQTDTQERLDNGIRYVAHTGQPQHLAVRQRLAAVDVPAIKVARRLRPRVFRHVTQKILGGEAAALLVMVAVQPRHHIIETVPVLCGAADLDVEQEADQCALVVVVAAGDERRARPGAEAHVFDRFLNRLFLHVVNLTGHRTPIGLFIPEARADQNQRPVVAGKTLRHPQQRCELLAIVPVRPHLRRADPLHVPRVVVLVRIEPIRAFPDRLLRILHRDLWSDVKVRVGVLQTAAIPRLTRIEIEEGGVALVGRPAEQLVGVVGDLLQRLQAHAAARTLHVLRRIHSQPRPDAVGHGAVDGEMADERRVVDQLVIVTRQIDAGLPALLELRGHFPPGGQLEADPRREVVARLGIDEQVRTVEKAEIRLQQAAVQG